MAKRPSFQFYPGDWLRDRVAYCSIAAQGLWLRMMIIMHDNDPYGYLTFGSDPMPEKAIAQACGVGMSEYRNLLQELDAAGVPSRRSDGALFSRRMVKDEEERQSSAERMRKSRRTSAQQERNTAATTGAHEDEDEGEEEKSLSSGEGSGEGPIDGDPWGKPQKVYHKPDAEAVSVAAIRDEASRRALNPHLPEVSGMLRDFGFNVSNAAKYGASLNATPERVRWLCGEAKRLAEAGKIAEPIGYVIAGIRDAKDPDPGPAVETSAQRRTRVLTENAKKIWKDET